MTYENKLVVHDHGPVTAAYISDGFAKSTGLREYAATLDQRGYINVPLTNVMLARGEMAVDNAK